MGEFFNIWERIFLNLILKNLLNKERGRGFLIVAVKCKVGEPICKMLQFMK